MAFICDKGRVKLTGSWLLLKKYILGFPDIIINERIPVHINGLNLCDELLPWVFLFEFIQVLIRTCFAVKWYFFGIQVDRLEPPSLSFSAVKWYDSIALNKVIVQSFKNPFKVINLIHDNILRYPTCQIIQKLSRIFLLWVKVRNHRIKLTTNLCAVKALGKWKYSFCAVEKSSETTVVLLSLLGLHENARGWKCSIWD